MSSNTKERWTLMFYFASDNALAHEIVSQLKSLKNAGFQQNVNVVAYFDPQPVGTPAHVFDINAVRKAVRKKKYPRDPDDIGFAGDDPFVRDLVEDRLWRDELNRDGKKIRNLIIKQSRDEEITFTPPKPPLFTDSEAARNKRSGPKESLQAFLNFCAENYKAEHYMLFILGHGVVVGDDVFLLDEHAAKHSVTLIELGMALEEFKRRIGKKAQFELVGFHSCALSGLEVAFQLQGTANYMLASQGPAFVGSWPYRQILIRVFKDVANPKLNCPNIEVMLNKIFSYVYFNSKDYLLAGYSFDLCLCDLRPDKIKTLEGPIKDLSKELVAGLKDQPNPLVKYLILLAHWESQSFFQENYTDLYDFCLCLRRYCETPVKATGYAEAIKSMTKIQAACERVRIVLRNQASNRHKPIDPDNPSNLNEPVSSTNPVIQANFAGPDSQFSHGLSVYFPWARPTDDQKITKRYKKYNFKKTRWFNFLDQYWGKEDDLSRSTMRDSHKTEVKNALASAPNAKHLVVRESDKEMLDEDIVSLMFNAEGPLNVNGALNGLDKSHPEGSTGDGCTCGSIKNFPRDTRARSERGKYATDKPGYPSSNKT